MTMLNAYANDAEQWSVSSSQIYSNKSWFRFRFRDSFRSRVRVGVRV